MKLIISILKPYLRRLLFLVTLFFVFNAFKDHWQKIGAISIERQGWLILLLALIITILAHLWSGFVWVLILKELKQPVRKIWALKVYLKTNIAKYLPGNIWHFYGRIRAVSQVGGSLGIASISVVLEPLLMAGAAVLIALLSYQLGWLKTSYTPLMIVFQISLLAIVIGGIHPHILNPVIRFLNRMKDNDKEANQVYLQTYPWVPLLGELGFILLRGTGFLLTLMALMPLSYSEIPLLLSGFSFAWLLGLIVPGAPGGIGIFEATTIALLDKQFPPEIIITTVALFRIISVLAEITGIALAYINLPLGHLENQVVK